MTTAPTPVLARLAGGLFMLAAGAAPAQAALPGWMDDDGSFPWEVGLMLDLDVSRGVPETLDGGELYGAWGALALDLGWRTDRFLQGIRFSPLVVGRQVDPQEDDSFHPMAWAMAPRVAMGFQTTSIDTDVDHSNARMLLAGWELRLGLTRSLAIKAWADALAAPNYEDASGKRAIFAPQVGGTLIWVKEISLDVGDVVEISSDKKVSDITRPFSLAYLALDLNTNFGQDHLMRGFGAPSETLARIRVNFCLLTLAAGLMPPVDGELGYQVGVGMSYAGI